MTGYAVRDLSDLRRDRVGCDQAVRRRLPLASPAHGRVPTTSQGNGDIARAMFAAFAELRRGLGVWLEA
jgi:hypothetical protein